MIMTSLFHNFIMKSKLDRESNFTVHSKSNNKIANSTYLVTI